MKPDFLRITNSLWPVARSCLRHRNREVKSQIIFEGRVTRLLLIRAERRLRILSQRSSVRRTMKRMADVSFCAPVHGKTQSPQFWRGWNRSSSLKRLDALGLPD